MSLGREMEVGKKALGAPSPSPPIRFTVVRGGHMVPTSRGTIYWILVCSKCT